MASEISRDNRVPAIACRTSVLRDFATRSWRERWKIQALSELLRGLFSTAPAPHPASSPTRAPSAARQPISLIDRTCELSTNWPRAECTQVHRHLAKPDPRCGPDHVNRECDSLGETPETMIGNFAEGLSVSPQPRGSIARRALRTRARKGSRYPVDARVSRKSFADS